MFLKIDLKFDKVKNKSYSYYKLCESFRIGKVVKQRTIHNLGSLDELNISQPKDAPLRKLLADRIEHHLNNTQSIFPPNVPENIEQAAIRFAQIIKQRVFTKSTSISNYNNSTINSNNDSNNNSINDSSNDSNNNTHKNIENSTNFQEIDMSTIQNENIRQVGAESICFQALQELELAEFLIKQEGWSALDVKHALIHLIAKACNPASERRTATWIQDNSAVAELFGLDPSKITRHHLYPISRKLYKISTQIETYLAQKTTDLFSLQNQIVLYDLTNTYFEGRKESSTLAKFGRSKEKRTDAKLLVLALVVNQAGFVQYSEIHEGNFADSNAIVALLKRMKMRSNTSIQNNATVVIDAGIATEDSLQLLLDNGYNYVCVSRSHLKKFNFNDTDPEVLIKEELDQLINVKWVYNPESNDRFLKINSLAKEQKEQSMFKKLTQRLEKDLADLHAALSNPKNKIQRNKDKINHRLGRLNVLHSRVYQYYTIQIITEFKNDKTIAVGLKFDKNEEAKNLHFGEYFIRTNLQKQNEKEIWNIYNSIRQVESTFRCLKTDLDLRPIFHKNDIDSKAHLQLGIVAYCIVNTIRQKLKKQGINDSWTTIRDKMQTQVISTITMRNKNGKLLGVRKCSKPNAKVFEIKQALNYKNVIKYNEVVVLPKK